MAFDLKTLAKAIAPLAPTLATMLLGPFAGTAVGALETAFGITTGAGGQAVSDAMQTGGMTPDIAAKIHEQDQKHAEVMAQQNIDLQKVNLAHDETLAATDVEDRASARAREIAVKDATPAHLAYVVIGGFMGITLLQLIALMFLPDMAAKIPSQGWLLIGNVSGYLAGEAKQAGAYYWGSTARSATKDDTINTMSKAS